MTIEESINETIKQGVVEWSTDSVIFPEKLVGKQQQQQQQQTATAASTADFAVVQQDPFRVILVGASHPSKESILALIASAINLGKDEAIEPGATAAAVGSGRQVLEADFTTDHQEGANDDLADYLDRITEKRIDLVIYLLSSDDASQLNALVDRPDAVVWPLALDEQPFATRGSLVKHLAHHLPGVPIMDVVHDASGDGALRALSVQQFLATPPGRVQQLLDHCPHKILSVSDAHQQQQQRQQQQAPVKEVVREKAAAAAPAPAPTCRRGISTRTRIMGLLAAAVAGGAWWKMLHPSSSLETVNLTTPQPPVGMRLNPMWDAVDPETLEHLFVVELDAKQPGSWHEQQLTVMVQGSGNELAYPMTYEPGSTFHYSALVPSPCLLDRDNDLDAHVVWRYEYDDESLGAVEKVVDRVVLSTKACQPVSSRKHTTSNAKQDTHEHNPVDTPGEHENEQQQQQQQQQAVPPKHNQPQKSTVAIVQPAFPFEAAWQAIIDKLKSKSHRMARVVAAVWHSVAQFWQ